MGVSCISPPLPARKFDVYLWSGRALSHRQDAGRLKAFMFIALCERYDKRCFPAVGGDSNITNREYLGDGEKWKVLWASIYGALGKCHVSIKGVHRTILSGTAGPGRGRTCRTQRFALPFVNIKWRLSTCFKSINVKQSV